MPKPQPGRKPKKPNKGAQHERFKETARALGASETAEAFERAVAKIIPRKSGKVSSK